MKQFLLSSALAISLVSGLTGAAEACTVDTPVSLFGADGKGNGIISNDGLTFDGSLADQVYNGGTYDGVAHLNGSADCSQAFKDLEKEIDQGTALAAAMSAPVWLGEGETFRISGGVGFTDGEAAVGATGLYKINKNLAGYAGGAVATSNSDVWSAKAGLSVGW